MKITFNFHLAFNMSERHNILKDSIGFSKEKNIELEQIAMDMVINLIIGTSTYIVCGTLLEAVCFTLYNSTFHPFAKILDISEDSQGKLFQLLMYFNLYE